jgi:hypothetical protein
VQPQASLNQPLHIVAVRRALLEVRSANGDKYVHRFLEPGESYPPRVGYGWTVSTDDGSAFEWRLGDRPLGLLAPAGGPVQKQSVDLVLAQATASAARPPEQRLAALQPVRYEPQTPAPPQTPEPGPWRWSDGPVPAGYDIADPVQISGAVEKIEFRETTYIVFVRARTIDASVVADPFFGTLSRMAYAPRPNSALWELSPTHYWGDRDAVNADLRDKSVSVRGYRAVDKSCAPVCRMHVQDILLAKSSALPPLSETPGFSAVDFAVHYNTASFARALFMGRVQRIEFGERVFDIYVQTDAMDATPGWTYQVRSEYRHPRAEIEKLLLNQVVVVAGWRAKTPMDTVQQSPTGIFGTDFELQNGMKVTPAGEKLLSEPPRELRLGSDPDALPFIPPGFADRVATFDMTAMVAIEGKIVRADAEGVWVEAQRFDPVSMPGARPGTIWRVVGGSGAVGKTITVRGWNARDKSCKPTCLMENRQSSTR